MRLFPKPDARFRAAAATLAAVALLVTMLIWRPEGILAVALALVLVLLALTAGVAVTAARESATPRRPPPTTRPASRSPPVTGWTPTRWRRWTRARCGTAGR